MLVFGPVLALPLQQQSALTAGRRNSINAVFATIMSSTMLLCIRLRWIALQKLWQFSMGQAVPCLLIVASLASAFMLDHTILLNTMH